MDWASRCCKCGVVRRLYHFFNLTLHFSEEGKQKECRGESGREGERKAGRKKQKEQQQVSGAGGYLSILDLLQELSRGPTRKRKLNQFHAKVFSLSHL